MNRTFLRINPQDIKTNLINLKQLVLEVTEICNLNCTYCGYGDFYEGYDPRINSSLSLKKAYNILDFLALIWEENYEDSEVQPFTLSFYGGEPLIGIKFIKKVIKHVESLQVSSKKFHYSMTTNGLLLTKNMDFLVDKEFRLLISLDGNEHDNSYRVDHRGFNSHLRIIENLENLKSKFPEYFERFVRFNTVLHNRNSVESAHEYIKTKFGKNTRFSRLNNSGIREDRTKDYLDMVQNINESIEKTYDKHELENELFLQAPNVDSLSTFLFHHSGNVFDKHRSLLSANKKIETIPTGTCTPFYKKMFVTANGKILPCEMVNHEFATGQVTENDVEINVEHIAKMYNDYVCKFINQCKTCSSVGECKQCVFQHDKINSRSPKCISYTSRKGHQDYVCKNLNYLGANPTLYKKIMDRVRIEY